MSKTAGIMASNIPTETNMSEISIGDVVCLKSGGPAMTVEKVGDYTSAGATDGAFCSWFDGAKRCSGVFPRTSLKHTEPVQELRKATPSRAPGF